MNQESINNSIHIMPHSSKFDLNGISKIIFKNENGEILFTRDMTDRKIMIASSSKLRDKKKQDRAKLGNIHQLKYAISHFQE